MGFTGGVINGWFAVTPEQIDQIASKVRDNLLNSIDMEVNRAMADLSIDAEISNDDWQAIIDQVLA